MFKLLLKYKLRVGLMIGFMLVQNVFTLVIPKIVASGIDTYSQGKFVPMSLFWMFSGVTLLILVFGYLQGVMQTLTSERAARDIREDLAKHISKQSYAYIQQTNPAVLLTNLTSDADAVKGFVGQAASSMVSSVFLILGSAILLLITNWKLAIMVLILVPIIAFVFSSILKKVRELFIKSQQVIDWLNKVINESILGAAAVRVLAAQDREKVKFAVANTEAKAMGMKILGYFSLLIPAITFLSSLASVVILVAGGSFVINGSMSIGDFAAFTSYLAILIFPIFMLGFMSNVIARAGGSYGRIMAVMNARHDDAHGNSKEEIKGHIQISHIVMKFGEKSALADVSFEIKSGSKTAVIGPTAAGKTQLLYLMCGLIQPTSGTIMYDGKMIDVYDQKHFHREVGIVFQDSVIFNMTLRENIAFSEDVTEADIQKAVKAAELTDFINDLPEGLDTVVSERGGSLSGGQKQRIMLARSLALNPHVLLLDDFTARVDANTEKLVLENVTKLYPNLTLISVTQKIMPVEHYDQIVMLMEGEVVAMGTHKKLLKTSPEYAQLYDSQRSTNKYEIHAEK